MSPQLCTASSRRTFEHPPPHAYWLIISITACSVDASNDEFEAHRAAEDVDTDEVVYRHERLVDAEGNVVSSSEQGVHTDPIAQRTARPWHYLDEGSAYTETAWRQELEDGTAHEGYEIAVQAIEPPNDLTTIGQTGISDDLAFALSGLADQEDVNIFIKVAHQAPALLPLLPPSSLSSAEDYASALAERKTIEGTNAALFEEDAQGVVASVEDAGGTVGASLWSSGRIAASVAAGEIEGLMAHPDVLSIELQGVSADGACSPPSHGEPAGDPVPLTTLRSHTGVQDYLDVGYHGQPSLSPLLVGIHEGYAPEDEACFFADFNDCATNDRLKQRFECDAVGGCVPTPGYAEADEADHGTWVSSIVMGDYQQGQGTGFESEIAPGLLVPWRNLASGFGKEVEAHYYAVGATGGAVAFDCARNVGAPACAEVDVLTSSNAPFAGVCNPASQSTLEDHLEDLWDAGVLPVVLTHNDNRYYAGNDSCLVRSPADLPKAFAVGALEPDSALPYDEWRIAGYSNRGGATSQIGNSYVVGAMTLVDLVASGFPGYVTDDTSAVPGRGQVDPDGTCEDGMGAPEANPGTSFATPQVAAAAALAKHRMISHGRTWIEYPGRLHALMLSMGDRATNTDAGAAPPTIPPCVSGDRLLCGGDKYFGFGRLHLRLQNTYWTNTRTFTPSSSDHVQFLWSGPIGNNREILKCVMQQREDMSGKTDISRVSLGVRLTDPNPINDRCEYGWWSIGGYEIEDDSSDDKHMVAVVDADENINGKCVEIMIHPDVISSAGAVTVHVWCYVDDELDH